jgi:hypothetical protein
MVYNRFRDEHIFCKSARQSICDLGAYRVAAFGAVIAFQARYFGRNKNPVSRLKITHTFSCFNDLAANLMPGYHWGSGQSVPFNNITAANPAGDNLYKYFTPTGLGLGHIFYSDIFVVIPFSDLHVSCLLDELEGLQVNPNVAYQHG